MGYGSVHDCYREGFGRKDEKTQKRPRQKPGLTVGKSLVIPGYYEVATHTKAV